MNKVEMETKLSTLWIFVMLNMICADILSLLIIYFHHSPIDCPEPF